MSESISDETEALRHIVQLLPMEVAEALASQRAALQTMVLRSIRTCVDHWEEHLVLLDPVQFEIIVGSLGIAFVKYGEALTGLQVRFGAELDELMTRIVTLEGKERAVPDTE